MQAFFDNNKANIFPHVKGSKEILQVKNYRAIFPKIIDEIKKRDWRFNSPKYNSKKLENNAFIKYGLLYNYMFFDIQKEDQVLSNHYIKDSKLLGDTLLRM